jgi:hypothetical protein
MSMTTTSITYGTFTPLLSSNFYSTSLTHDESGMFAVTYTGVTPLTFTVRGGSLVGNVVC